jgi:hypothetical protein
MEDKDRFMAKLRGDPIGQDALGRDVFIGDLVTYAVTSYQSALLRFGRVISLKGDKNPVLNVRLVSWDWRTNVWAVGNVGRASTVRNILRLDDPPQQLLDLFEEYDKLNEGVMK